MKELKKEKEKNYYIKQAGKNTILSNTFIKREGIQIKLKEDYQS